MTVSSAEELRVILEGAAYDRMIGTSESSWIDFKGKPYLLNTDRGTWELCKDVAAFANAGGGCIVVGVATEKPDTSSAERAAELRPVPAEMVDRERYRDVISAGVYPVPQGLDVDTFVATNGGRFLVIWIPAQSDATRPFLVRYLVDLADRRLLGFGWPIRVSDAVTWQPVRTISESVKYRRAASGSDDTSAYPTRWGRPFTTGFQRLQETTRSDGQRGATSGTLPTPSAQDRFNRCYVWRQRTRHCYP